MKNSPVFSILLVMFCLAAGPSPARAGDVIHVVTPEWERQTNRDGSGLFFDIVRAVYQPAGIAMTYTFFPWKRCQATVNAKRADAMLCVWQAHARKQNQLIPRFPIFVEKTVAVFKNASRFNWHGIHTLDYKRAVWLRGYDYHKDEAMAEIQLARWHEVDSHEDAWRQLNLDRFDMYIEAQIDLDNFIREHRIDMNLYEKKVLWRENAYVAFANTERSKHLIRVFDRRIQEIFKSGELARIYRRWNQAFDPEPWQAASE